ETVWGVKRECRAPRASDYPLPPGHYPLEIAFLLLLLHRSGAVVIDDAALSFRARRQKHLLDDRRQGVRTTLHCARQRVAAERAEANPAQLGLLAVFERHAIVIHHDERAVASHDGTLLREVKRHDRDVLKVDVLPNIELGPIRKRKDAQALAFVLPAVVLMPELGTLPFGVPAMLGRTEREHTFLRARLLFIASSAAESGIEPELVERLLQGLRLHDVRVNCGAVSEGADSLRQPFFVDVDEELEPELSHHFVAKRDHFPELPRRID